MAKRPSDLMIYTLVGVAGLFACLLLAGIFFKLFPQSLNRHLPRERPGHHLPHRNHRSSIDRLG
ncbi:MAG: hypothetical protein KME35_10970 [Aphanocapsa sp. GSE-SYN-MK-11-07L]|jgi:hypothetical protein|nr:hypothetical protein [Aphanocapsa sp. GSE-SYN-MK-11-07L]